MRRSQFVRIVSRLLAFLHESIANINRIEASKRNEHATPLAFEGPCSSILIIRIMPPSTVPEPLPDLIHVRSKWAPTEYF